MTLTRTAGLARTQMRKRATVKLRMALRELEQSRQIVIARAGGRCEMCGGAGAQVHHRRPRMAGGSAAVGMNAVPNLVFLCVADHADVESNRDAARAAGWLLTDVRHAERVAVRHHSLGWVRLLSDGTYEDATEVGEAFDRLRAASVATWGTVHPPTGELLHVIGYEPRDES